MAEQPDKIRAAEIDKGIQKEMKEEIADRKAGFREELGKLRSDVAADIQEQTAKIDTNIYSEGGAMKGVAYAGEKITANFAKTITVNGIEYVSCVAEHEKFKYRGKPGKFTKIAGYIKKNEITGFAGTRIAPAPHEEEKVKVEESKKAPEKKPVEPIPTVSTTKKEEKIVKDIEPAKPAAEKKPEPKIQKDKTVKPEKTESITETPEQEIQKFLDSIQPGLEEKGITLGKWTNLKIEDAASTIRFNIKGKQGKTELKKIEIIILNYGKGWIEISDKHKEYRTERENTKKIIEFIIEKMGATEPIIEKSAKKESAPKIEEKPTPAPAEKPAEDLDKEQDKYLTELLIDLENFIKKRDGLGGDSGANTSYGRGYKKINNKTFSLETMVRTFDKGKTIREGEWKKITVDMEKETVTIEGETIPKTNLEKIAEKIFAKEKTAEAPEKKPALNEKHKEYLDKFIFDITEYIRKRDGFGEEDNLQIWWREERSTEENMLSFETNIEKEKKGKKERQAGWAKITIDTKNNTVAIGERPPIAITNLAEIAEIILPKEEPTKKAESKPADAEKPPAPEKAPSPAPAPTPEAIPEAEEQQRIKKFVTDIQAAMEKTEKAKGIVLGNPANMKKPSGNTFTFEITPKKDGITLKKLHIALLDYADNVVIANDETGEMTGQKKTAEIIDLILKKALPEEKPAEIPAPTPAPAPAEEKKPEISQEHDEIINGYEEALKKYARDRLGRDFTNNFKLETKNRKTITPDGSFSFDAVFETKDGSLPKKEIHFLVSLSGKAIVLKNAEGEGKRIIFDSRPEIRKWAEWKIEEMMRFIWPAEKTPEQSEKPQEFLDEHRGTFNDFIGIMKREFTKRKTEVSDVATMNEVSDGPSRFSLDVKITHSASKSTKYEKWLFDIEKGMLKIGNNDLVSMNSMDLVVDKILGKKSDEEKKPELEKPAEKIEIKNLTTEKVRELARDPMTNGETLHELAKHESYDILHEVGRNPNLGKEDQIKLIRHEDPLVRGGVAQNKNIDPEVIEIVLQEETSLTVMDNLRNNIRDNAKFSRELFAKIEKAMTDAAGINDYNEIPAIFLDVTKVSSFPASIRVRLASSKKAPPNILSVLSHENIPLIRKNTAANTSTPSTDLDRMAKDDSEKRDIRKAAVANTNISPETLKFFLRDEEFALLAVSNTALSGDDLLQIARNKENNTLIRAAAFKNPNTPVKLFLENQFIPSWQREAIGANTSLTAKELDGMLDLSYGTISKNQKALPKLEQELAKLIKEKADEDDTEEKLKEVTKVKKRIENEIKVVVAIAKNPNTRLETLKELRKSSIKPISEAAEKNRARREDTEE